MMIVGGPKVAARVRRKIATRRAERRAEILFLITTSRREPELDALPLFVSSNKYIPMEAITASVVIT